MRVYQITRIVWLALGGAILAGNGLALLLGFPGPMPTGEAITPGSNALWSFFDVLTSLLFQIIGIVAIILGVFQRPQRAGKEE